MEIAGRVYGPRRARESPLHRLVEQHLEELLRAGYLAWLAAVEHSIPGAWFSASHTDLWEIAPRLISVALVVHGLIRVYVGAGSDLVLPRLRLRYGLPATRAPIFRKPPAFAGFREDAKAVVRGHLGHA